eukprot:CAMPEP_0195035388 /NCGR_PEP_ID=MMETSP0326_2-20130528/70071_1 /TAXON_ID=2866 ORGANISM="Crypthecodinium cohnii, Strain Seligo" /NCGR_SAMPLE_ID=MMETSP0326_2 /ASSEMBLY_ACC=CAM_ASM_000348 /LENGTH=55 /DNA_ID=CAMNT_0040060539 /DNA_START=145 /DNA_END=312 /DNA_ORIENTATION=-
MASISKKASVGRLSQGQGKSRKAAREREERGAATAGQGCISAHAQMCKPHNETGD